MIDWNLSFCFDCINLSSWLCGWGGWVVLVHGVRLLLQEQGRRQRDSSIHCICSNNKVHPVSRCPTVSRTVHLHSKMVRNYEMGVISMFLCRVLYRKHVKTMTFLTAAFVLTLEEPLWPLLTGQKKCFSVSLL